MTIAMIVLATSTDFAMQIMSCFVIVSAYASAGSRCSMSPKIQLVIALIMFAVLSCDVWSVSNTEHLLDTAIVAWHANATQIIIHHVLRGVSTREYVTGDVGIMLVVVLCPGLA